MFSFTTATEASKNKLDLYERLKNRKEQQQKIELNYDGEDEISDEEEETFEPEEIHLEKGSKTATLLYSIK